MILVPEQPQVPGAPIRGLGEGGGHPIFLGGFLLPPSRGHHMAVQARFSPSLGVAWQTKAAITSKRTFGRVENFWGLPPAFPMALVELAIRENGVGVYSFFGVTPKVRNWVVTQFRKPAEEVRVLRARFEDELRKFKAAEVKVRESCGGKRQGGFGLKEKERKLRDAATAHSKKAEGLLLSCVPHGGKAKSAISSSPPRPKCLPLACPLLANGT